jgi:DNA-directed RNA polymerase subunit F
MKNNIKKLKLIESGFKPSTIINLTETQINILYEKVKSKKETSEAELSIDPKNPNDLQLAKDKGLIDPSGKIKIQMGEENIDDENSLGKLATQSLTGQETPHDSDDMAPDGMDDDSDNNRGEMNEKFKSKSQQKYFFARCNDESLSKKERNKWCKMADEFASDTKDFSKLPEKKKKETKENYLNMVGKSMNKNMLNKIADIRPSLKWENVIETELEKIVERNLSAKVTKKDFLSLVNEVEVAPAKPKVKPGTKPAKPGSPYSPKPGPKPAPKADVKISPAKPAVMPGTKPAKPGSPYSPKPGPKPAPKAQDNNLPEWLSFDKLGIKFK